MTTARRTMGRDEVLAILRQHRDVLREQHHVKSLAVFGSVARDEAGPESDVDVLVEFDGSPVGLFAFARLQRYLEEILGGPVDLVTRNGLKPRLRARILREAIDAA